jgi:alpha-glucosidase
MYGTLEDFDKLAMEAKNRNIRVILDFVVNHTSDQHKWFLDSKSSKNAEHRDWYIWKDGEGPNQPPNNWMSTFGLSAWKFDPTTNFQRQSRAPGYGQIRPAEYGGEVQQEAAGNARGAARLRKVADEYDAVLIGETWTSDVSELKDYYGPNFNELQLPMDLLLTQLPWFAPIVRKHVDGVDAAGGWPTYVITNHNIKRSYTRYGDGVHNDDVTKMMAGFYLTLRGTAIIYYGEELGMENNDPTRKEDVKDPIGVLGWPLEKGRDGERAPMQWTSGPNAGFTTGKPWLAVPPSAKTHNVETESKEPDSVLSFYKRVLKLRRGEPAFREGKYVGLNESDPNVMSYLRQFRR